jgi:hypothetical protein
VWWYRRRLPDAVAAAVGRREWWLSLRTTRLRTARRRADEVDARLALTFASVGAGAREGAVRRLFMGTRAWIEELARRWAEEELEEWETERGLGKPLSESVVEGYDAALDMYREALEDCRTTGYVDELADKLLASEGRTASVDERALLGRLLMRAMVEVLERQQARADGDYRGEPLLGTPVEAAPRSLADSAEPTPLDGPTVSEAIALYVKDHEGRSWSPKMAGQAKVALRYFEEVVGSDTRLRSVGKEDIRRYRDALERLPARVGSTMKYRGKGLSEILAMGDPPGLGDGQVNTYVQRNVGGLFNWAIRMDYVERNPAVGMTRKVKRDLRELREPFTDADLAATFSADFADLRDGSRPEDYWLPLLQLHTGARNEEVAQLATKDVEDVDGVPCIQIRADQPWQKLKTPGSRRRSSPDLAGNVRGGLGL